MRRQCIQTRMVEGVMSTVKAVLPALTEQADNVDCFFFSSRKRHTKCSRDLSSDVCSSDLVSVGARQRGCLCDKPGAGGPNRWTVYPYSTSRLVPHAPRRAHALRVRDYGRTARPTRSDV